jgi:cytochrome c oxidase subunit 4
MDPHHANAPAHAHAHHDQAEHVKKHVRVYVGVFIALLVGTLITVGASYIQFSSNAANIALALVIAIVKASLVAGFFMHLVSEKKTIYVVLVFTAFFFAGLMALTIWAMFDFPAFTHQNLR